VSARGGSSLFNRAEERRGEERRGDDDMERDLAGWNWRGKAPHKAHNAD